MKQTLDIEKCSEPVPDTRFRQVFLIGDQQRCAAAKFLRFVRKACIAGAVIVVIWVTRSDFAFAPQPIHVVAQGAPAALFGNEQDLEAQLRQLEGQIRDYDQRLQRTRQERRSLQRDVSLLENTIQKLNLQVRATDLEIRRLSSRISDTQVTIDESRRRIASHKEGLGTSLQAIYETDRVSPLEMLFASDSIADFFAHANAIYAIQLRIQIELDQVYALKRVLEDQEIRLSEAKEDQVALLQVQMEQRQEVNQTRRAREQLLRTTMGQESRYQELKRRAERTAAEIRAQLFRLRDGAELSFGDAYDLARFAAGHTGVRPALILAVLTQESALGRNVGRCRYNQITSRGTTVMRSNQQAAFREIVTALGMNPETVPVSCPIFRDGAFGGAMGIGQFMPLTWRGVRERVLRIIGRAPSPWDPQSAFTATALYLADAGAAGGTEEEERRAAAKYYAGGNWRRFLRSYGDRVMRLTRNFQEKINALERQASR